MKKVICCISFILSLCLVIGCGTAKSSKEIGNNSEGKTEIFTEKETEEKEVTEQDEETSSGWEITIARIFGNEEGVSQAFQEILQCSKEEADALVAKQGNFVLCSNLTLEQTEEYLSILDEVGIYVRVCEKEGDKVVSKVVGTSDIPGEMFNGIRLKHLCLSSSDYLYPRYIKAENVEASILSLKEAENTVGTGYLVKGEFFEAEENLNQLILYIKIPNGFLDISSYNSTLNVSFLIKPKNENPEEATSFKTKQTRLFLNEDESPYFNTGKDCHNRAEEAWIAPREFASIVLIPKDLNFDDYELVIISEIWENKLKVHIPLSNLKEGSVSDIKNEELKEYVESIL